MPTDVLAFSQREDDFASLNPDILGDVVISVDTAKKQAEESTHSFEIEIFILLIHGILHLMGFDHEKSKKKAEIMQYRERELLKLVSGGSFKT